MRDSIEKEKPEWLGQMEAVLEVLNEGVVICNDRHRILFANSQFLEMTGIPPQELIGCTLRQFYSSKEWDFLMRQLNVAVRTGHKRCAFVVPRKDGGRLSVIVSSRTVHHSGKRFRVKTFTDISEQMRATEELRSASAKLQKRQKDIEEDLRLAARVQQSLTPKSLVWGAMKVEHFYHPVHSIGGDFALVNSLDGEHLSLLVGDVSGHGIGSALVATRVYFETSGHLRNGMPFVDMFEALNRLLIENIGGPGLFVTLAAAQIDARRRCMMFSGAGHPPAMVARPGQNPLLLESRSMVLGLLPNAVDVATDPEVHLEPDDRIILHTDGITEVFNSGGQMLGVDGLQEIVRRTSFLPPDEMKHRILDEVAAWREGPPTDDASLMLVHVQ
ncbi:MAG TPA: SpoIIE family protein phosphatase [Candidatus Sulfotelmatobacter sp.]|nr:SpoIIE family protein phosphatase [Candidatus Sulfotelmatobacter sp.]